MKKSTSQEISHRRKKITAERKIKTKKMLKIPKRFGKVKNRW